MKQVAVFERAILAVEIALANDAGPEMIARAVMEAIMEPSATMSMAGWSHVTRDLEDGRQSELTALWQAMLRAAMDENVEG